MSSSRKENTLTSKKQRQNNETLKEINYIRTRTKNMDHDGLPATKIFVTLL